MIKIKNVLIKKSLQAVSLFLIFIIINEMLKPIISKNGITDIKGISLFIFLLLLINLLFKNILVLFIGGIASLVFSLEYMYNKESLPLFKWIEQFIIYIKLNLNTIFLGQFQSIANEVKIIVLLTIVWVVITFYLFLLKHNKSIWIVIFSAIYISFFNMYFAYDGKWSIVVIITFGLFLIGIEAHRKLTTETVEKKISLRYISTILIIAISISVMGLIMPKADAKWFNGPSFFEGIGTEENNISRKYNKIGYGYDDSYLGGSLIMDDTIIMETKSNQLVYWRGESKDFYTGHGWINSESSNSPENIKWINIDGTSNYDYPYHLISSSSGLDEKIIESTLIFPNKQFEHFFTAGDFKQININGIDNFNRAETNTISNKIYVSRELDGYYIKSTIPVIDLSLLRKSGYSYPEEISKYYLQLPDNLPNRVKELGKDITEPYDNPYDKVNAIRNYLRINYTYETKNIAYPKENEDFVDNFLFKSKEGYCDHFSSSMVVLTRSIGIPARWVKGYSSGEISYSSIDNEYTGIVRNNDAHSWVEVYFEGIGWIQFEPTSTFSYPNEYKINNESVSEEEFIEITENINNDVVKDENDVKPQNLANNTFNFQPYILMIAMFIVLVLLFYFRKDIYYNAFRLYYTKKKSTKMVILLTTSKMLSILEKQTKREKSQTVREYLTTIYQDSTTKELEEVINMYEYARYSDNKISETWKTKIWELWNIIFSKNK